MIAVDKPVLTGKRLIEDAIPIDVVSRTSASEKVGGRIGHPASLHLWWARRPLAASRAAVYAALVPANGHHRNPAELAEFFDSLCRWGGPESAIRKAREEVLAANGGEPPMVVDLFAGGGAIPLEAARLGCEVTANELNPVAHLIERMMLEYPQAYPGLGPGRRRRESRCPTRPGPPQVPYRDLRSTGCSTAARRCAIWPVIVVVLVIVGPVSNRRQSRRPVVIMRQPVPARVRKTRRVLAVIVTGTAALVLLPSQLAAVAVIILAILWRLAGKLR